MRAISRFAREKISWVGLLKGLRFLPNLLSPSPIVEGKRMAKILKKEKSTHR